MVEHFGIFAIIGIWYTRGKRMANLNIRNLPDEVHQALKIRAALNNWSTEAEIRAILIEAVQPLQLEEISKKVGLIEKPNK